MGKIGVTNNITLDGVMQAPGGKEEDFRDGFKYGGWAAPYNDEVNPFSPVLDNTEKYVASKTLKEPLPWKNSTLLKGDAVAAVAKLKEESKVDLTILGSGELVRSLMQHDLIDAFILLIHPLVLGSGRRMFSENGSHLSKFKLTRSVPTTTGVIIATYELA